jgi:TRAP-type uncharacterized transport system substrate-binding protein
MRTPPTYTVVVNVCAIAVITVVGGLLTSCQLSSAQKPGSAQSETPYYLATGTPSGAYVLLGDAIRKADPTLNIIPCTTGGSTENLKLLRNGDVKFAIVQMDSLHTELSRDNEESVQLASSVPPMTERNSGVEEKSRRDISLVTYLYSEKLHLFVRPHFYLNSPAELRGIDDKHRVWLGPSGSGTYKTALKVLESAGLSQNEIRSFRSDIDVGEDRKPAPNRSTNTTDDMDWDTAAARILHSTDGDGLYAYFRMMGVPRRSQDGSPPRPDLGRCPGTEENKPDTPKSTGKQSLLSDRATVEHLLENDVRILGLPQSVIDRMTEDKLYVPASIELSSYRNLKRGVGTIGVTGVLVTNLSSANVGLVQSVITAIEKNKSKIEEQIGGIELDQFNTTVDGREFQDQIKIHDGARLHLQPKSNHLVWWCLTALAIGMMIPAIIRDPAQFRRRLARGSYVVLLGSILGAISVLTGFALMRTEGRLNPEFSTLSSSIWNTLRFVLGLNRDYQLMTREGEVFLWVGLLLFPMVLGWLTSDVIKASLRDTSASLGQKISYGRPSDAIRFLQKALGLPGILWSWIAGRPTDGDGPIVFVNWNEHSEEMANEIRENSELSGREIVVLQSSHSQARPSKKLRGVNVLNGDPLCRQDIRNAGISQAAFVAIFSSWPPGEPKDRRQSLDPDTADTKTIRAILTIGSLCDELNRQDVLPVKAQIHLSRNRNEASSATTTGRLEVTCLEV